MRSRLGLLSIMLLAVLAVTGAVLASGAWPPSQGGGDPNAVCEGVSAEVGGCDADQPTYTALTCEGVGQEFGTELDRRVVAIINGAARVDGESQAVRAGHTVFLVTARANQVTARANQHLRDRGMVKTCGGDEFMRAAEARFSPALKARAGDYLYDSTTRPYAEWLADVRRTVGVIDMAEDEPFLPPSGG